MNVSWGEGGEAGETEGDRGRLGETEESRVVIVGIGGVHYCPKLGDLARGAGVGVGHILPSYVPPPLRQ